MIIVSKDNLPVACYGDIGPSGALREYAQQSLPGAIIANIVIDKDGAAILEWQGKKYDAVIYLEVF